MCLVYFMTFELKKEWDQGQMERIWQVKAGNILPKETHRYLLTILEELKKFLNHESSRVIDLCRFVNVLSLANASPFVCIYKLKFKNVFLMPRLFPLVL